MFEAFGQIGLSLYFLLFAFVGLAGLLLTGVFGIFVEDMDGHLDHGDSGHGYSLLSLRVVLLALTGCGLGGFAGAQSSTNLGVAVASGVVGTVVFVAVGVLIMRLFHSSQASSTINVSHLIGTVGTITTPIPCDGVGEVQCTINGFGVWYSAKSTRRIPSGTPVRITHTAGSVVFVEPVEQTQKG